MIDRKRFYDSIRTLFGTIKQPQVDGMEAILNEWETRGLTDLRQLAYILATTYHETARTMQPIEEYGKGKGKKYGKPDSVTGQSYYGRGFVQLTWDYNYKSLGALLNVDLYHHPEKALELPIATQIMFEGMIKGLFTGKKLSDYFNSQTNWVNARKIINGLDKAKMIADYAQSFYQSLTE